MSTPAWSWRWARPSRPGMARPSSLVVNEGTVDRLRIRAPGPTGRARLEQTVQNMIDGIQAGTHQLPEGKERSAGSFMRWAMVQGLTP